jgi:hypothetical protein
MITDDSRSIGCHRSPSESLVKSVKWSKSATLFPSGTDIVAADDLTTRC